MRWMRVAGLSGALAVIAGAFGAHWLNGRVEAPLLEAYRVGATYHLIHSAVLLGLAVYAEATRNNISRQATLLVGGVTLFSGSLYALGITGVGAWGAITPLGGLLLIAAWLDIALGLIRTSASRPPGSDT